MASSRLSRASKTAALRNFGVETEMETSSECDGEISEAESNEESVQSDADHSSDDEEFETNDAQQWHFVQQGIDCRPEEVPEFLGIPGMPINFQVPENPEESVQFFVNQLLNDEIVNSLCLWTNIRAGIQFDEEIGVNEDGEVRGLLSQWKDVTPAEMRKFLGLTFLMGLNRKPEMHLYWSQDDLYQSEFFSRPESLTRNRYQSILRFLRFADYNCLSENDALRKIRPFLGLANDICQNTYVPEREVSVDEKLMLFKGRLLFKQYIPSKRSRYGIKTYALCEAKTGYMFSFLTHENNQGSRLFAGSEPNVESLSISERIVVELSKKLLDRGYHIYMDNWYNSVRLTEYLLTRMTLITGTIQPRRGVPHELQTVEVPEKQHRFIRKENILIVKLVDRRSSGLKTVYLIDSAGEAADVQSRRFRRGGTVENISKPEMVTRYNEHMGGVDLTDSCLEHYDATRKCYRWFTKYGIYIIQTMIRNSWVIYQKAGGRNTYLSFLEQAIRYLVLTTGRGRGSGARGGRPVIRGRVALGSIASVNNVAHVPQRLEGTASKPRPAKRCRMCYSRGTRKETVFVCKKCVGEPGLCAAPCFGEWHSID